jgi:hypothetical protein
MPAYLEEMFFSYLDTEDYQAEITELDVGITGMVAGDTTDSDGNKVDGSEMVLASYIDSDQQGIVTIYDRSVTGGIKTLGVTVRFVFPPNAEFPSTYYIFSEEYPDQRIDLELSNYNATARTFDAIDAKVAELIAKGDQEPHDLWGDGKTTPCTWVGLDSESAAIIRQMNESDELTDNQKTRINNLVNATLISNAIHIN